MKKIFVAGHRGLVGSAICRQLQKQSDVEIITRSRDDLDLCDQSAVYKTEDPNNQADINKLYGLSDCGTNHMESSIRFGWRWYDDSLEIHWFKHSDSKFSFGKICNVTLGLPFKCSLKIKEDKYVMNVDGNEVEIIRAPCGLNYHRYYLYPYFGGDETAPHYIRIKIKNEKNM